MPKMIIVGNPKHMTGLFSVKASSNVVRKRDYTIRIDHFFVNCF